MNDKQMKYEQRGVSASKEDVHTAIKNLDKGLYPNAFCKILPDVVGGQEDYVNIMHADTAGTKTALAYLMWKQTGELGVWKGIVQDAVVMNVDDLACVGCVQDIILSSTIGRNKHLISADVISEIINHLNSLSEKMRSLGINWYLAGGETADVGDIVRTIDVGYTAFARMPREKVIDINISAGNQIVGFSSSGQASYEDSYNSGIGSNGLTSARHDVLDKSYAKNFPEAFDPNTPDEVVFCGSKKLTDYFVHENEKYRVGDLLLSPTRTYVPLVNVIVENFHEKISGLVHCTGGGQTKVLNFTKGVKIVKQDLFDIPPVFELIRQESHANWRELYNVFNMGHRLEVYCQDMATVNELIKCAQGFNIDAKHIGEVQSSQSNELELMSPDGWLHYAMN